MMRMKGILGLLALTTLGVVGWQVNQSVTAKADDTLDPVTSVDGVLARAPQGILPEEDYFKIGDNQRLWANGMTGNGGDQTNHAKFYSDGSKWIITLAKSGENDVFGTAWSKEPSVNLNQNFKSGMWLFMSPSKYNISKPGAGMAFVLRSRDSTLAANNQYENAFFPQLKESLPSNSENLAVWGLDTTQTDATAADVASKGLQHSWALEFDSNSDNSKSSGAMHAFDLQTEVNGQQHIASNYPGEASTYKQHVTSSLWHTFPQYTEMVHEGIITDPNKTNFLTDSQWHHLTLDYQAPTSGTVGKMTYTFDDKNPNNGNAYSPDYKNSQQVGIDLSKLGDPAHMFWGFTATTGKMDSVVGTQSEYAAMTFESLPGEAEGQAEGHVRREGSTKDLTSTDTVSGNDKLQVAYDLKWIRGNSAWRDIKADLNLPNHFKVLAGKVIYPDGRTQDLADNISAGKLGTIGIDDLGPATAALKSAKVELEIQADNVDYGASADPLHNDFKGSNVMTTADLPDLNIKRLALALNVDEATSTLGVNSNNNATINGTVVPEDTTTVNSDITLTPTLKGTNGAADTELPAVKMSDQSAPHQFSFEVPSDKLHVGDNQLTLVATDKTGLHSNETTTTITVGTVKFGDVSATLDFGSTALTGHQTVLLPKESTTAQVVDTQTAAGTWKVGLTASTMKNAAGSALSGHLFYQDGAGKQMILGAQQMILTAEKSTGQGTNTTSITSGWGTGKDDTGIKLAVDGSALRGEYTGDVTWTLQNTP